MGKREIGDLGEKIAFNYLKNKGYQILDKNYSFRIPGSSQKGEIDIITRESDIISFIEVKTLQLASFAQGKPFLPEDKVNFQKKRKIAKVAESWLMKKKIPLDAKWQIDVISITIDLNFKKARISHFKNV